jgi:hypothetical protein
MPVNIKPHPGPEVPRGTNAISSAPITLRSPCHRACSGGQQSYECACGPADRTRVAIKPRWQQQPLLGSPTQLRQLIPAPARSGPPSATARRLRPLPRPAQLRATRQQRWPLCYRQTCSSFQLPLPLARKCRSRLLLQDLARGCWSWLQLLRPARRCWGWLQQLRPARRCWACCRCSAQLAGAGADCCPYTGGGSGTIRLLGTCVG